MRSTIAGSLMVMGLALAQSVSAEVLTISASGSLFNVTGDYAAYGLYAGQGYSATFTFDTNFANASHYTLTPSNDPNDPYTAAYTFSGGPYGVSASANGASGNFVTDKTEVRVVDNLFLNAGSAGGFIVSSGNYDLIEIMGHQGNGYCPLAQGCTQPYEYAPLNAEEVSLYLVGSSSWFSGGALPTIPNNVSALFSASILTTGVETGSMLGTVNSSTVSAVPVPAAAWLLGSGLIGLAGAARKRKSV